MIPRKDTALNQAPHSPADNYVPEKILEFLDCETPRAWLEIAVQSLPILLIDHASCEKKAASTALRLMFRYSEEAEICYRMSRLAREELRHYEQVLKIIQERNIKLISHTPSRYAASLMSHVSREEPKRIMESLIVGGIIEARSCERFARLVPYLKSVREAKLAKFYSGLLASEARHFEHYLELARKYSAEKFSQEAFDQRVAFFLSKEKELIESTDDEFHFHSGLPS